MGKQASQALRPHEIEGLARQQNRMNNPNQENIFGSTQTTFGADDQANIVQTLSEPMERIINSQMDFVSQGPAQLGDFSNPFIEQMLGGVANSIGRRGGFQTPSTQGMGNSYQGTSPQFNVPAEQTEPDPEGEINPSGPQGGGFLGGGIYPNRPIAGGMDPSKSKVANIGAMMSQGGNPYAHLGNQLGEMFQRAARK